MYKKILIITLAAIGLSFLASSCVKESGFDERVKDIVSVRLDSLNKHVTVLEKTQTALNDSLKNVKGNVESLAKQSKDLTDSIAAVKVALAAQKELTEEKLKNISDKVADLEKKQGDFKAEVYERLGLLESRIQKIDVVPQYSDGSVDFCKGDNVLNFIVRPDSVAKKLAAAHPTGDSTFSFIVVPTLTKAVTMDTLNVKGVAYADGILSVTVKDEQGKIDTAFYKGEQSYSACLVIGDGNSDNTSGFFPLTYKQAVEDLTPDVFYQWTSATPPTDTVGKATCAYEIGVPTGLPYGDGGVNYLHFAKIDGYDRLEVTATEGTPRFLMNRDNASGQAPDHMIDIPNQAEQTARYETKRDNGDGTTTYIINIALIKQDKGYAHLHAVKGANWANVTVTSMKFIK